MNNLMHLDLLVEDYTTVVSCFDIINSQNNKKPYLCRFLTRMLVPNILESYYLGFAVSPSIALNKLAL
ncbi:hypothetical protein AQUCO_02300198v1 [Aquilegia coerulea]|uniref:Uncharacterized protein n=1 Tax=Aquilegia coerulea TaxID=218851 RepID=A0A2G5DCK9_AQUCA|nr:hypothetical protein AQUCO_02300198v1 [Aquilegia coerulea]